jgi:hypothetical protein
VRNLDPRALRRLHGIELLVRADLNLLAVDRNRCHEISKNLRRLFRLFNSVG